MSNIFQTNGKIERCRQGQGTGEFLFMDAKHDKAAAFYRQYGFESLPDQPLLLWLTSKNLSQLF